MQNQIPNHPFVPFNQIFKNLADQYIHSHLKRKLFLTFSKWWLSSSGIAKAEKRIKECFLRGEDGFSFNTKRLPSLFYPELAASFILNEPHEEEPLKKSAKLIVSALRFRSQAMQNQLEQEYEAGKPLDMQRYKYLFSRFMSASLNKGKLTFEVIDAKPSEHIIVAINGIYYKLRVLKNQQIIPMPVIYEQLSVIAIDARTQSDSSDSIFPFGLLTTVQNKKSTALFQKLQKTCVTEIEEMNAALFFLAIDIDHRPKTLEEIGQAIHVQNFHNRDYRHSLQIVITGNGHTGIIVDPIAGIGGTLSAHFLDVLAKECDSINQELIGVEKHNAEQLFQQLKFDSTVLTGCQHQLLKFQKRIQKQCYPKNHNTAYHLDGLGRKDFSQHGISVDGAFHAALHLAYKHCFGKTPYVGNFINLRCLQHGDIFRYGSTTPEMGKFLNDPNIRTLHAAINAHKTLIKKIKTGTDDIYQSSMMLLAMYNQREINIFQFLTFVLISNIFIKGYNRRFLSPDIWASSIPSFAGLSLVGRPGVKHRFLAKLVGHYMMFDHHLVICFLSKAGPMSLFGKENQFASTLHQCLNEIKQMATENANNTIVTTACN